MTFLINTSNLKAGGGIQVADSIINQLPMYIHHKFIIVLSDALSYLKDNLSRYNNCKFIIYNIPQTIGGALLGSNRHLDGIVQIYNVDAVFTVFGPSLWRPKVKHVCGFARPQLIYPDSPFFKRMNERDKIQSMIREKLKIYNFSLTSDWLVTESKDVSNKLEKIIRGKKVYTITNNYNQIYNEKEKWERIELPSFDGITLLTISANHPHKNLKIIPLVLDYINSNDIPLKVRFIITLSENEFKIGNQYKSQISLIGKVNIKNCPSLFQQTDYMFLPTLLECFSASYPEAMKMETPIITSNLPFAHSLCGDAAVYVDSLSPKSIVDALLSLTEDKRKELINRGKEQLKKYDTAEERCRKVIELLENINKI